MTISGIIEGLTVDLRSVLPEDAEITYLMRTDKTKVQYMHKMKGTVEEQRNYILNQNKKEGDYLFLVINKQGQPIGMRGIYNIKADSAESGRTIGYGDAFQNMEALLLGLDFAYYDIGVSKIYMDAATENLDVRGIQNKLGAVEIERKTVPDFNYEIVTSILEKEVYIINREIIYKLIKKHSMRTVRKDNENII